MTREEALRYFGSSPYNDSVPDRGIVHDIGEFLINQKLNYTDLYGDNHGLVHLEKLPTTPAGRAARFVRDYGGGSLAPTPNSEMVGNATSDTHLKLFDSLLDGGYKAYEDHGWFWSGVNKGDVNKLKELGRTDLGKMGVNALMGMVDGSISQGISTLQGSAGSVATEMIRNRSFGGPIDTGNSDATNESGAANSAELHKATQEQINSTSKNLIDSTIKAVYGDGKSDKLKISNSYDDLRGYSFSDYANVTSEIAKSGALNGVNESDWSSTIKELSGGAMKAIESYEVLLGDAAAAKEEVNRIINSREFREATVNGQRKDILTNAMKEANTQFLAATKLNISPEALRGYQSNAWNNAVNASGYSQLDIMMGNVAGDQTIAAARNASTNRMLGGIAARDITDPAEKAKFVARQAELDQATMGSGVDRALVQLEYARENGTISKEDYQQYMAEITSGDQRRAYKALGNFSNAAYGNSKEAYRIMADDTATSVYRSKISKEGADRIQENFQLAIQSESKRVMQDAADSKKLKNVTEIAKGAGLSNKEIASASAEGGMSGAIDFLKEIGDKQAAEDFNEIYKEELDKIRQKALDSGKTKEEAEAEVEKRKTSVLNKVTKQMEEYVALEHADKSGEFSSAVSEGKAEGIKSKLDFTEVKIDDDIAKVLGSSSYKGELGKGNTKTTKTNARTAQISFLEQLRSEDLELKEALKGENLNEMSASEIEEYYNKAKNSDYYKELSKNKAKKTLFINKVKERTGGKGALIKFDENGNTVDPTSVTEAEKDVAEAKAAEKATGAEGQEASKIVKTGQTASDDLEHSKNIVSEQDVKKYQSYMDKSHVLGRNIKDLAIKYIESEGNLFDDSEQGQANLDAAYQAWGAKLGYSGDDGREKFKEAFSKNGAIGKKMSEFTDKAGNKEKAVSGFADFLESFNALDSENSAASSKEKSKQIENEKKEREKNGGGEFSIDGLASALKDALNGCVFKLEGSSLKFMGGN